jgi:hypothetical protein
MGWLGLISIGLVAEICMIIVLGRSVTDRYEAGQAELREITTRRWTSAPGTADAGSTDWAGRREDPLAGIRATPAPPAAPGLTLRGRPVGRTAARRRRPAGHGPPIRGTSG